MDSLGRLFDRKKYSANTQSNSVAVSYLNRWSRSFSKLSTAPSASNCSGVSARTHNHPTPNWPPLLAAPLPFAIQHDCHGTQNGSLPVLCVAVHRVCRILEHHFGSSCTNSCRNRSRSCRVVQSSFAAAHLPMLSLDHNSRASQRIPTGVRVFKKQQGPNNGCICKHTRFLPKKAQEQVSQKSALQTESRRQRSNLTKRNTGTSAMWHRCAD